MNHGPGRRLAIRVWQARDEKRMEVPKRNRQGAELIWEQAGQVAREGQRKADNPDDRPTLDSPSPKKANSAPLSILRIRDRLELRG